MAPKNGRRGRKVALTKHQERVPPEHRDARFLTDEELFRRDKFAIAYCTHGVKSKAAKEAGYTGTTAHLANTASMLLREQYVKDRIEENRANMMRELRISQRDVLAEYARIAFFDISQCVGDNGEILPLKEIPLDTRRALAGYEIERKQFGSGEDGMEVENRKIKAFGKTEALGVLSKYLGIIKDDGDGRGSLSPEKFLEALLLAQERVRRRGEYEAKLLPKDVTPA